jgi:hypothetical protein
LSLPEQYFDSETVSLMGRVCTQAWRNILAIAHFTTPKAEDDARRRMVDNVMDAVVAGERDETRLADIALAGIEGHEGARPLEVASFRH